MKLIKTASSGKYKLRLDKKAWTQIGHKSGWIKTAKKYTSGVMVLEEGAYIQTPPAKWGRAKIVDMDLETILMHILTEQGENKTVDMDTLQEVTDVDSHLEVKREEIRQREERDVTERAEAEERARQREERQRTIQNRFSDLEHFKLLGFIGAHGNIAAQVPSDKLNAFEKEYGEVKGKKPEEGSYEIASPTSKWWRQYRVHVPKSSTDNYMLGIMNKMGLNPKDTTSNYDINDSRYVLKILDMGFDIGSASSQNVDAIERNIKEKYGDEAGDAFIDGYSY